MLFFLLANASHLSYRMARMKVTPCQAKRGGETKDTMDEGSYKGGDKREETLITGAPPYASHRGPSTSRGDQVPNYRGGET